VILLISASWVARITDVRHKCLLHLVSFLNLFSDIIYSLVWWSLKSLLSNLINSNFLQCFQPICLCWKMLTLCLTVHFNTPADSLVCISFFKGY
jgi:hypothetical protein